MSSGANWKETESPKYLKQLSFLVKETKEMLKNALTKTARCQKEIKPTLKEACSQVNESAICVQKLDDSRNSAIRITYRISLRSSSLREPRYPLLRVVVYFWSLGDMLSHITTTRVQSN